MIYRTESLVRALGIALGLLLVAGSSWAADPYPSRPIRWVVPWPAGGVADTQARIIADHLGKALGQQVVIDNRTGASETKGSGLYFIAAPLILPAHRKNGRDSSA